jgi:hypothetical protein
MKQKQKKVATNDLNKIALGCDAQQLLGHADR